MRILVLTREYPPIIGGAGVVSKNLAEEWVRMGHEVDVITARAENTLKFEIVNGARVYRVPVFSRTGQTTPVSAASYIIFGLLKSLQLFLKNRYDLISTHFAVLAGPIGAILSKLFKVPDILTIVGGDIYEPSKKLSPHNDVFLKPLVRWVLNNSTEIIAISNNTKENAEKYYNPARKIKIIPVGFKVPRFNQISRGELGLKEDKIYLISVGRLAARKNFKNLISAFSKVTGGNTELLIIGDGPLGGELRVFSIKTKAASKIRFFGAVSEEKKFQYLSVADVFILPSLHEGFGIVFQEAMYCGLPIIAGNNGGQTDFLKNNENALLVNPNSIDDIADAIRIIVNDAILRDKLREKSKKDIEKLFIDNIARQYINIMEQHY